MRRRFLHAIRVAIMVIAHSMACSDEAAKLTKQCYFSKMFCKIVPVHWVIITEGVIGYK